MFRDMSAEPEEQFLSPQNQTLAAPWGHGIEGLGLCSLAAWIPFLAWHWVAV